MKYTIYMHDVDRKVHQLFILLTTLFIVVVYAGTVSAECIFDNTYPRKEHKFGVGDENNSFVWYEWHYSDSLSVSHFLGATAEGQLGESRFGLMCYQPLLARVTFRGRGDHHVWTSGLISSAIPFALSRLATKLSGGDTCLVPQLVVFTLSGGNIIFKPHKRITLFAGYLPNLLLLSKENGLLFQQRAGLRIKLGGKEGFCLGGGISRADFWGSNAPSRSFRPGWFVNFSMTEKGFPNLIS